MNELLTGDVVDYDGTDPSYPLEAPIRVVITALFKLGETEFATIIGVFNCNGDREITVNPSTLTRRPTSIIKKFSVIK